MWNSYGLIGYPLSHSASPAIMKRLFQQKGLVDVSYEMFPLEEAGCLKTLIGEKPQLKGLNVTIPHKRAVIPTLDELSPEARAIGAVNTIKVIRTGGQPKLKGFNTDAYGFEQLLNQCDSKNAQALIFGDGGAAKAVKYVLKKREIYFRTVSRKSSVLNYENLTQEIISRHPILINTTPVGMYPNIDEYLPIPESGITPAHILIDLIYNPELTSFMKMGADKGAQVMNGALMLEKQAEKSLEIWLKNE